MADLSGGPDRDSLVVWLLPVARASRGGIGNQLLVLAAGARGAPRRCGHQHRATGEALVSSPQLARSVQTGRAAPEMREKRTDGPRRCRDSINESGPRPHHHRLQYVRKEHLPPDHRRSGRFGADTQHMPSGSILESPAQGAERHGPFRRPDDREELLYGGGGCGSRIAPREWLARTDPVPFRRDFPRHEYQ